MLHVFQAFDQVTILEEAKLEGFKPDSVGFVGAFSNACVEESACFVFRYFELAHQQNQLLSALIYWHMHYKRGFYPSNILYAENCPEQPLINHELPLTSMVEFRSKDRTKSHNRNLSYEPHIINKWKVLGSTSSFADLQHDREMASLKKRIRECKSLGQRKKDRNDPILYPAYFIRGNKRSRDARIDGYFKQILTQKKKYKHNSKVKQHYLFEEGNYDHERETFMVLPQIPNSYSSYDQYSPNLNNMKQIRN